MPPLTHCPHTGQECENYSDHICAGSEWDGCFGPCQRMARAQMLHRIPPEVVWDPADAADRPDQFLPNIGKWLMIGTVAIALIVVWWL